jgi:hypothetical protein
MQAMFFNKVMSLINIYLFRACMLNLGTEMRKYNMQSMI